MSDQPKIVINGVEVAPGKKVKLSDHGLNIDDVVRKAREEKLAQEQAKKEVAP